MRADDSAAAADARRSFVIFHRPSVFMMLMLIALRVMILAFMSPASCYADARCRPTQKARDVCCPDFTARCHACATMRAAMTRQYSSRTTVMATSILFHAIACAAHSSGADMPAGGYSAMAGYECRWRVTR